MFFKLFLSNFFPVDVLTKKFAFLSIYKFPPGKSKSTKSSSDKLTDTVQLLISMRNEARSQKNFALSDQIRDQLAEIGIQLKDGKDGTTFSVE